LPHILMGLLNDESKPEAIWWLPGEKEFAINADLFPTHVLEEYFPGSKYASFIRRLHKLGFSRQTRVLKKVYGAHIPQHAVAFRHDKFQRDKPELLGQLTSAAMRAERKKAAAGSVASSVGTSSPLLAPATAHHEAASLAETETVASLLPPAAISFTHAAAAVMPSGVGGLAGAGGAHAALLQLELQKQRAQQEQQLLLQQREYETQLQLQAAAASGEDGEAGAAGNNDNLILYLQEMRRQEAEADFQRMEHERMVQLFLHRQQQMEQQAQAAAAMEEQLALRRQMLAASLYQEQAQRQQMELQMQQQGMGGAYGGAGAGREEASQASQSPYLSAYAAAGQQQPPSFDALSEHADLPLLLRLRLMQQQQQEGYPAHY